MLKKWIRNRLRRRLLVTLRTCSCVQKPAIYRLLFDLSGGA